MIRSMTGFGAASLETEALRASVTARSLNHRFLDAAVHLPRRLQSIEAEVRARIASRASRGRIEVHVQASFPDAPSEVVVPCRPLVATLVRALRDMQNEFGLEGGVAVSDLVRVPGALERVEVPSAPSEEARRALLSLVEQALDELESSRQAEGEALGRELQRALGTIEEAAQRIEGLSRESRDARQSALLERARALAAEVGLEDARLYQEVVRAVERLDVAEELQRLRSHTALARGVLAGNGPSGRRLDFLAQELMREANTIGSKAAEAALVHVVVALKTEIERLREQVQNVE
jgi:uncharacterized protein (TIGR00255 family)